MTNKTNYNKGFISRLLRDSSANTLAIGAAAIFPLVAIIGGGVDMSRSYLVKTRLQQACDAATLAARKQLSGDKISGGNIPSEIQDTADNFFEVNFEEGTYGTQARAFTLSAGNETRMDGAASVNVPTTLMGLFGYDNIPVAVDCQADLNLPNIDIMLVLDTSGSMGFDGGTPMVEMKAAVLSFYDEIMGAKPDGARVRFGVVPYSAGINVGKSLSDENPDFLVDSREFQTRRANFDTTVTIIPGTPGISEGDVLDSGSFRGPVPQDPNNFEPRDNARHRWDRRIGNPYTDCNAYDGTYVVGDYTYVTRNDDWYSSYYSNGNSNKRGACIMNVTYTRYATADDETEDQPDTEVTTTTFRDYTYYQRDNFDVSQYKLFTPTLFDGAADGGNDDITTWNGCIEERATVVDADYNPIPAGALDLDIDLIPDPSNPDTQWRPMWREITFDRDGPAPLTTDQDKSRMGHNCPDEALRLTEFPLSGGARNATFESYINGLSASGNTMHTIGMIWGARFLSENGIFAADNSTAPNGDPIVRHLIFMTDGAMNVRETIQTAYGTPNMDGRYGGTYSWDRDGLTADHNLRLDALCSRIKNQNTTVWTVSFRLSLDDRIKACASGDQRAFEAVDANALTNSFRTIATSIAELRLIN